MAASWLSLFTGSEKQPVDLHASALCLCILAVKTRIWVDLGFPSYPFGLTSHCKRPDVT